jgi:hypothetical protein
MKWLISIILLPTLAWANCDGLKEAIESCSTFACEITTPEIGKVMGYKVEGLEGDKCVIVSESTMTKADMGEICKINEKLRPLMWEKTRLFLETTKMSTQMPKFDSNRNQEEMLEEMQATQRVMLETFEQMKIVSEKIITANNGKDPCSLKDPKSMALFASAVSGATDNLKEIAFNTQSIDKKNFTKLFPDGKSACIVSTEIQNLDKAKKLTGVENQEECKNLATANCSTLFDKAKLKNQDCPTELNILYADAQKASGKEVLNVPTARVTSISCEINGMMIVNKKMSYDPAFKKQNQKYCKTPRGYKCDINLYSQSENAIDSKEQLITSRNGAETNCLKLAKKLAKPHCKTPDSNIVAIIRLTVEGHKGLSGVLMNQTFKDFCYTHRLKKVFN